MYLLSALHGHGTSSAPSARAACRPSAGRARTRRRRRARRARPAHAGHDPHRHRDVGRVGQLDADVATCPSPAGPSRTARRTSCGPRIAPRNRLVQRLAHLGRLAPVVRRAGVLLALGADERAVLDARDVAGVRPGQVGVRALGVGELLEGPGVDELLAERGRTPRRSRRTSGSRRAGSARRSPRPRPAASRSGRCGGVGVLT